MKDTLKKLIVKRKSGVRPRTVAKDTVCTDPHQSQVDTQAIPDVPAFSVNSAIFKLLSEKASPDAAKKSISIPDPA